MKPVYRKSSSGSVVKFDSDPSNDFQDGANSRDRYWRKRLSWIVAGTALIFLALGMALELVLLLEVL